eukprot:69058_1
MYELLSLEIGEYEIAISKGGGMKARRYKGSDSYASRIIKLNVIIKYGGDFPYLSNYQEVHLHRHLSPHIITTQGNINVPKIKLNITKLFESKSKGESNKKKQIFTK